MMNDEEVQKDEIDEVSAERQQYFATVYRKPSPWSVDAEFQAPTYPHTIHFLFKLSQRSPTTSTKPVDLTLTLPHPDFPQQTKSASAQLQ